MTDTIPPALPDADIDTLTEHFTGKRRELFLESIAVLRESLAQGAWVKRGAQRAGKGIGKGLASHKWIHEIGAAYDDPRRRSLFACYMAAKFGNHLKKSDADTITDDELVRLVPKVPVTVTRAWMRLMVALRDVYEDLDASRPLPVYTEIGLSPKVTATLQDIGLDLDLATRRMAPIDWRWEQARDSKTFEPVFQSDGTPKMVKVYFVKWPNGTVFGTSRFAGRDCEACGKRIPSRSFVPILITNKAGVGHGFWFGCDCARNILGIKDAGLERRE